MKRRIILLALLTSLSLTGCDLLNDLIDGDAPGQKEEEKYTITFSANGGTGTMSPVELTSGEYTLPQCSFIAPSGKEFSGWKLPSGTILNPGDKISVLGNITLTAQWKQKAEETIKSISISGDLTKKEYIVGESWSSDGLSVVAHYDTKGDETLSSNRYYFSFNPTRPALGITSLQVTANLLESDLVTPGKTFTVSVKENVVPAKEIEGIYIDGTLNKTVYNEDDNWSSEGLSVTAYFDDDSEETLTFDKYDFIFSPSKATKGTTQLSVYAKLKGSDIRSETARFVVTVNSTVVPTNYTVMFNGNGATFGTMSNDYTDGHTYVVPNCSYTCIGHSFDKWALNSVTGEFYSPGETITDIYQNITLYAIWKDDGSQSGDEYNGYYKNIDVSSSNLLEQLRTLNKNKRTSTVGYNGMGTTPSGDFRYTDYDPSTVQYDSNGQPYGTKLISFYSGNSATSGMNREHVWPKSHGGNLVEADIHMPRPTIEKENGSRGNSFYVEGKKDGTYGWDPAMESFGDETYRGDSARIIFYCVIASSNLSLVELEYHQTSNSNRDNLMGKLSDMLSWNLRYPVTDREQRRNDGAQYLQGNRNPFIDHPEYACKIWGSTNDATKKACGIN